MFSCRDFLVACAVLTSVVGVPAQSQQAYPGIGRIATPQEVKAWDIDVRPDFKGLPAGSGSVARGQEVWESKCASCHGIFGESNEVFTPLIGGTTAEDIKTGRVANLLDPTSGRTMLMKLATVSTLWDYINRAMPWNQPKSLSTEEVYAVTAFLLHLGGVVPDNFVLSDKTMADVQARLPNRHGMTTRHALWPGAEFNGNTLPDVRNTACMKNCATEARVASLLPEFARNAHGNLAEQNRVIGAQHGADTSRPEVRDAAPARILATKPQDKARPPAATVPERAAVLVLLKKHSCTSCHGMSSKIVGPAFSDIAKKHDGKADYLTGKIKTGGSGVWGGIPMPSQNLPDADARLIGVWLAAGATP